MHGTLKICGLSTPETLEATLAIGVEMVGFVFFTKSPRHISLAQASALTGQVKGRAQKVALSVNANDDLLAAIIAALKPDLLQLHGDETPERVVAVKGKFGMPVLKAIGIAEATDLEAARKFESVVDGLLFDAKPPKDAVLPGGNGLAFDWHLLQNHGLNVPVMMSGGLNPYNVRHAILTTRIGGVDVSSGVESAPGVKDNDKIAAFVAEARAGFIDVQRLNSAGE